MITHLRHPGMCPARTQCSLWPQARSCTSQQSTFRRLAQLSAQHTGQAGSHNTAACPLGALLWGPSHRCDVRRRSLGMHQLLKRLKICQLGKKNMDPLRSNIVQQHTCHNGCLRRPGLDQTHKRRMTRRHSRCLIPRRMCLAAHRDS